MPEFDPQLLLLVHAAATWMMVGVIWYVQLNAYPIMGRVGAVRFADYERFHQSRTGLVVIPPMLAELATSAWLAWAPPPGWGRELPLVGLGLVIAIWASTFLVQVPLHERLARGFDANAHRWLVLSNWGRTILWSARGVLALAMLA